MFNLAENCLLSRLNIIEHDAIIQPNVDPFSVLKNFQKFLSCIQLSMQTTVSMEYVTKARAVHSY